LANPQANQFTRLSNELYGAIMQSDFSKRQRNIIDMVIRFSYGCGKKTALLRHSDFEQCGVGRNKIKTELEYLEKAKVVFRDGDLIQLNKDYDQWRVNLIKSFNQSKFTEILKRNLSVPKTGTITAVEEVPETGTDEIEEFPKRELPSSQNGNPTVPKTGTDTPVETNGGTAFEPRKDIIKDSIKDINNKEKDIYIDAPVNQEENPLIKIEEHYIQQRGIGIIPSPIDFSSMQRLLEAKIPLVDILSGIDHAFKYYKPKHSRDRINSFSYCESVILDQYARKQARENANRESANYDGFSKSSESNTQSTEQPKGKWDHLVYRG
jgi:hypothetical protein